MGEGGECPSCGRVILTAEDGSAGTDEGTAEQPEVPWHFKLLVLATILYLLYRAVQGVVWLAGRL